MSAYLPWLELLVVALAAPALWFPTVRPSLTVLAIALLLLAWLAVALLEGALWPRSSLDWPVAAMILMAILGAWTSPSPELALPKVTGLLLGLAAYRAILRCVRSPDPPGSAGLQGHSLAPTLQIINALLLLACAFSVVGLVGGIRPDKLSALGPAWARIPRFLGALPGTQDGLISVNQLGGALLYVLPLSLALALAGRQRQCRLTPYPMSPSPSAVGEAEEQDLPRPSSMGDNGRGQKASAGRAAEGGGLWRPLYLLFSLFLAAALILTQSRSAIAGLAASLLLIVGLRWPWGRWLLLLLGLAATAGWLFWGRRSLAPMIVEALTKEGWSSPIGRLWIAGRFDIWARAWGCLRASPLLGCGLGTFRLLDAASEPGATVFDAGTPHAHNVFLQMGYDLGVPGLVAYLALLALAIHQAWDSYRLGAEPWRSVAIGALACLLGYHLYGLFDVVALGSKPGVLWWALLALIAGLPASTPQKIDHS